MSEVESAGGTGNVTKYEAELIDMLRSPLNALILVSALDKWLEGIPESMPEAREAAMVMRSLANTLAH